MQMNLRVRGEKRIDLRGLMWREGVGYDVNLFARWLVHHEVDEKATNSADVRRVAVLPSASPVLSIQQAAVWGVALHARAGEKASPRIGFARIPGR